VRFEIEYDAEEQTTVPTVPVRFHGTKHKNWYVFSHWETQKRLNFHNVGEDTLTHFHSALKSA